MPDSHWAKDPVYELVKLGVTRGYPDGTFRGNQDISRYEMAVFLSKFSGHFSARRVVDEKLVAELRNEVALLKFEQNRRDRELAFSSSLMSRARVTTIALRGGNMDYRLKLSLTRRFSEDSSLRVRLDTVDAGFNMDNGRPLAEKLIDIESQFKMAGLDWSVKLGPGVVPHLDDLFPSENNMIYIRPKTSVTAAASIDRLSLSTSYVTRQVATSGKIGVHELTTFMKYKFGRLALTFQPRYLFLIDGDHDFLAEVGLNYFWNSGWLTQLLWGVGDFKAGYSGMYAKIEQKMFDPWKTGTTVVLRLDKVGSQYRHDIIDEYEFCCLNNFDRLILDGTVDIGCKVGQRLPYDLELEALADYVTTGDFKYGEDHPGTYFIWQMSLAYQLVKSTDLNVFYRLYQVPSGMAQFSDPVPAVSDMIGVSLSTVL
ncbi:MAG: S-layer homology domain-containing protein [Candidatus Saganbacteria bacterium]|nr:S-layer homology domain-containing protein [Candidatus Saganbacteria bacterium]